jgi:Na+/H+ antiporter NhaD/arsenite permease-like protein
MPPLGIATAIDPNPLFIIPFLALLLSLATLPLLLPKFWEQHYPKVAVGFAAVAAGYYLFGLHAGGEMLGVLGDYASFMVVIGSLFVVSGGVHLRVKGEATPMVNCLYLLSGALLANVIGTTGASMLLIRPWIRMNRYRFTGHHLAFFIFMVSNIGGALIPVGPPLFMGYLKGVPFWWPLIHCWRGWTVAAAAVLAVFYVLDRVNFLKAPCEVREMKTEHEEWRADGLLNVALLAGVLIAIIFLPAGVRELVMLAAAAASWLTTARSIHEANHFTFGPIKEVAWIFAGIFATMKPVLDYMVLHAGGLGLHGDGQFYWLSGALSGVLDNAPTYLTFLAAAFGIEHLDLDRAADMTPFLARGGHYLQAISLGSTFFGAMTYLGNGPNLMVKAIADHARVHTPGFFAYIIRFSVPVLLPVFALVAWLFVHR